MNSTADKHGHHGGGSRTREPDADLKTRPYREVLTNDMPLADIGPRPETDLQALMEAAPHTEPAVSQEQLDVAAAGPALSALDVLDEQELFVVRAYVFERRTLQDIADEMGLAHRYSVSRIRDRAYERMADYLNGDDFEN